MGTPTEFSKKKSPVWGCCKAGRKKKTLRGFSVDARANAYLGVCRPMNDVVVSGKLARTHRSRVFPAAPWSGVPELALCCKDAAGCAVSSEPPPGAARPAFWKHSLLASERHTIMNAAASMTRAARSMFRPAVSPLSHAALSDFRENYSSATAQFCESLES